MYLFKFHIFCIVISFDFIKMLSLNLVEALRLHQLNQQKETSFLIHLPLSFLYSKSINLKEFHF